VVTKLFRCILRRRSAFIIKQYIENQRTPA